MGFLSIIGGMFGKSKEKTPLLEQNDEPVFDKPYLQCTYKTIENLFEQVSKFPAVVRDLAIHPAISSITASELHNIRQVLPPLIMNTAFAWLVNSYNLDKTESNSAYNYLTYGVWMIQAGLLFYDHFESGKVYVKSNIESLFAFSYLKPTITEKAVAKKTHCEKNCHGLVNSLHGSLYNKMHYYSNSWLVNRIPDFPVLNQIAWCLQVMIEGRYILGTSMTHCKKHERYKIEDILSNGLMNVGFQSLLDWLMYTKLGVPTNSWSVYVHHIPLLLSVAIAMRMKHKPISHDKKTAYDPFDIYENFTEFNFNALLKGYASEIKELLSGPKSTIDWNEVLEYCQHPYVQQTKVMLLPDILHSWDNFIQDPVVSPGWKQIRTNVMFYLKTMHKISKGRLIPLANYNPQAAAYVVYHALGVNIEVAEKLIVSLGDDEVKKKLLFLNNWFGMHGVDESIGVSADFVHNLTSLPEPSAITDKEVSEEQTFVRKKPEAEQGEPVIKLIPKIMPTTNIHTFTRRPPPLSKKEEFENLARISKA